MSDDSKCRKNVLCEFEVSRDLPDAQIEVCVHCGKKVVYPKDKRGRVDNAKYLRDHIRDTVQPFGRTGALFKRIYGEKVITEAIKRPKQQDTRTDEEFQRDIRRIGARKYL